MLVRIALDRRNGLKEACRWVQCRRIIAVSSIEGIRPQVDGGRFPIKRIVGDEVVVEADVFADGHEEIDGLPCNIAISQRRARGTNSRCSRWGTIGGGPD